MKTSHFKIGWIGIRASKTGRAARLLKRAGWIKLAQSDLNNRNGFSWVLPARTEADFNTADWRVLAGAGLNGLAVWLTDAQWGLSSGITDKQWQRRAIIEQEFNERWPNGHRV